MSFIDKVLGSVGLSRKESSIPLSSTNELGGILGNSGGESISASRAMSEYKGWAFACVNAIGMDIGNIPFKLYKVKKDESEEEVYSHEVLDLLFGVNDFMTSFELKFQTASHLLLTGNAFWLMLDAQGKPVTSKTQKPEQFYPLNPKYVTIKKTVGETFGVKYIYKIGMKEHSYESHQVLHFKLPNPDDIFEGKGVLQSIFGWVDADNSATEFNRRFFANSARPDGVLESEFATSPENIEYLKKSFEKAYRGIGNAHKTLVLPQKTTFKPAGFNQKDMDFVNLLGDTRDKILAGFRVPKTVLGLTDDVNRANAEATNYVFALRVVKPLMELITTYLNEFLMPRYGKDMYLDFDSPVPEDKAMELAEIEKTTAGKAILTQNEAREMFYGLGPMDGGDSIESQGGVFQLSAKRRVKHGRIPSRFRSGSTSKTLKGELVDTLAKALKDIKIEPKDVNMDEELWNQKVARITPNEKKLADDIKKYNDDQKARVIANLEKSTKAVNTDDLFDYEEEVGAMINLANPILKKVSKEEAKRALEMINLPTDTPVSPKVTEAVEAGVSLMVNRYTDTTLSLLKEKLNEGIAAGESLDQLTDRVGGIYTFSNEVRAEMVARSESFRAANETTRQVWKESGVVKSLRWYTARDELVCELCAPMDGEIVGIDEPFDIDSDYGDGYNPQDIHPQCRCDIRPEEITIEDSMTPVEEKAPEKTIEDIESELREKMEIELKEKTDEIRREADEKINALALSIDKAINE